ncbi:MAG: FkbM family methyltransferase [Acidobacteria bacterium]|nr:FkbM family methyltransferase [Acidobacteriota bacterium]
MMTESTDDLAPDAGNAEEINAKREFALLLYRLQHLPAKLRARLQGSFTQRLVDETLRVETPRGPLSFVLLGKAAGGRALTLLTKQPATIEWIDAFRPDGVFWDVGANVGTFSLYAAIRGDTRVVAFEPAAVNYFLLAANCEANKLDARIDALLLGLGHDRSIERLEVSQFESAQSFSFRGKADQQHRGRQAAIVLSADRLVEEYAVPCPNYIKIDAPGSLEAIISGALRTLQRPEVRELHLEVREQSKGGRRVMEMLSRSGFVVANRHSHGGSADLTFARPGA